MYNPYNWKIVRSEGVSMNIPVFPGKMVVEEKQCVLDELTRVSFERDLVNIEITNLLDNIKQLKSEIKACEEVLEKKLIEMSELDERLIKISSSLPVFEK